MACGKVTGMDMADSRRASLRSAMSARLEADESWDWVEERSDFV